MGGATQGTQPAPPRAPAAQDVPGRGVGGVKKGVRGDCSVSVLPAVTSRREPHLPLLRALLCAQGKG